MTHILFTSLGCDKNLVDAEVMLGLLERGGYAVTYDENIADAAVVNTCGFIKDAADESIEQILTYAELKKTARLKALIITGCLAERYKNEIFDAIPEADAVIGTGDYSKIVDIINNALMGKRVAALSDNNKNPDNAVIENRRLTGPYHYAYLKIAEGCDNCCTYCTIPQIRGRFRSRETESLLREAQNLADQGAAELIIVAQDTALYGIDLYGEARLHILLNKLSGIDGIKWLRVLYAYPEHITDELIAEMAQNPKVCKYIDMPVQHANDKILSAMGRKSTNADLHRVINKLREAMPDIALRTTLITGFPGETETEFDDLLRFIEDIRFDRLGVFEYSKEDGTPAAKFPAQNTKKIKRARKDACLRLQKSISQSKLEAKIGNKMRAIVDGRIDDAYSARTYMDCPEIDGAVYFKADYEIISGDFIDIMITKVSEYDLYGEIIPPCSPR